MIELDHVVVAVAGLDEAAARLEREHGLASYAGGRHPQAGTANRIVPLGHQYVELMAVVDPGAAAGWGPLVAEAAARGDRPVLWCLRTDDVDAVAARLGLRVTPGRRELPDGSALGWRFAGLDEALETPALPFFIQWDDLGRHPARAPADHGSGPTGIAWVEVAGDRDRLREWLGGEALPVRVRHGRPEVRAVAIAAAGGEIVLGAGL